MPEETLHTVKEAVEKVEDKITNAANKLLVNIPKSTLPFPMRLLTLLLLVGGLSILGSSLTDFVIPNGERVSLHFFRVATGIAFLLIAYGIYIRERWAAWLYSFIVIIGLIFNFTFAFIPALLIVYLYVKRKLLKPCFLDRFFNKLLSEIKSKTNSIFKKEENPMA